jgi:hypothetical protein
MTKIPKQKFNYGAPSTEGDIPPREITDVQPLLEHLDALVKHVTQAWDEREALKAHEWLDDARYALRGFKVLDAEHRERILAE